MTQSKSNQNKSQNKNQSQNQNQNQNQQSGQPGALSDAETAKKTGGNQDTKSSADHMSRKKAGNEQGAGGGAKQKQHRG